MIHNFFLKIKYGIKVKYMNIYKHENVTNRRTINDVNIRIV